MTLPVISAWALIKDQSSNLGLRCAISGFCKKASLLSGLNKPEVNKLFSTTFDISAPIFFFFKIFCSSSFEAFSIDNDETAIGKGFRFPLVISTSIKA